MFTDPKKQEINHQTQKLIVGIIAICLATITSLFSDNEITSISASYHQGGWARDYFVGSLFAIFAFFISYNGQTKTEMLLSKAGAIAALGVAMFPCECGVHNEMVPGLHGISAALLFLILTIFCYQFSIRAKQKHTKESQVRRCIYLVCGFVIIASIATLGLDFFLDGSIRKSIPKLTLYGEMAGLIAFGVAWLVASRVMPFITNKNERHWPFYKT